MSGLWNGSVSCADSSSAAVRDTGLYGWSSHRSGHSRFRLKAAGEMKRW